MPKAKSPKPQRTPEQRFEIRRRHVLGGQYSDIAKAMNLELEYVRNVCVTMNIAVANAILANATANNTRSLPQVPIVPPKNFEELQAQADVFQR